jgi:hypothetical protein
MAKPIFRRNFSCIHLNSSNPAQKVTLTFSTVIWNYSTAFSSAWAGDVGVDGYEKTNKADK